jgi:hypothetical protein
MMCSTRNSKKIILLAISALTFCGCASRHESKPVAGVDPIAPDEAMQKRDWPQVVAAYPNGSVAAGPTEFRKEPKRGMTPEWKYAFADTATFFTNMVLLPCNIIEHPLGEVKVAKGETVGPTYTAMPVLPAPLVYEPGTPPVVEPTGTESATPPVVEPAAPSSGEVTPPTSPATDITPATGEVAPPIPPATDVTPPVNVIPVIPAPAAPTEALPSITPQPGTSPTPVVSPTTDNNPTIAPPVPEATPPAPAAAPTTPPPADATVSPGVAPTTPTVIEPPPPEATKNLAPPIHPAEESAPTTQSDMNK